MKPLRTVCNSVGINTQTREEKMSRYVDLLLLFYIQLHHVVRYRAQGSLTRSSDPVIHSSQ